MLQHFKILILLLILSLALWLALPPPAIAEPYISETTPLDFATLEIPSSGTDSIVIDPAGSYSGNGSVISGTPHPGEYFIMDPDSANNGQSFTIDIQNITTGSSAIELDNFKGMYDGGNINNFPRGNLTAPGIGGKTLYLGAQIRYSSQVTDGSYHPSYNIVVIYE